MSRPGDSMHSTRTSHRSNTEPYRPQKRENNSDGVRQNVAITFFNGIIRGVKVRLNSIRLSQFHGIVLFTVRGQWWERGTKPSHAGLSCDARSEQLERVAEERQKFQQWEIANNQADPRFQDLMDNERKAGTTRACPKCHRFITKDGG